MKTNFFVKYIPTFLLHAFFLTSISCLAQNQTGVVSNIAEHIDPNFMEHEGYMQYNDLYNERITPWRSHKIISDTSISVHFFIGDPKCHRHRAVVQEIDDTIDIIVIGGNPYDDKGEGYACHAVAGWGSFLLHTQKPIGNRKITQNNYPPVELRKVPKHQQ